MISAVSVHPTAEDFNEMKEKLPSKSRFLGHKEVKTIVIIEPPRSNSRYTTNDYLPLWGGGATRAAVEAGGVSRSDIHEGNGADKSR